MSGAPTYSWLVTVDMKALGVTIFMKIADIRAKISDLAGFCFRATLLSRTSSLTMTIEIARRTSESILEGYVLISFHQSHVFEPSMHWLFVTLDQLKEESIYNKNAKAHKVAHQSCFAVENQIPENPIFQTFK